MIILSRFRDEVFDGAAAVRFIQQEFGVSLSPRKVHAKMHSMKQKSLVDFEKKSGRELYRLTDMGRLTLQVCTNYEEMGDFMTKLLGNIS